MRFVYSNPELERAIADANTLEELNTAFVRLSELVPSFLAPEIRGRQMFCPELDKQAARLPGRLGLADIAAEKSNDNVCIVATRFYGTGGHSKVASDIARLIGAERTTIVFTDLYSQLRERDLPNMAASVYPRRALIRLSAGTLVEKVLELHSLLAAIRPSRIFLLGNHMDMVAVAGCWPFRSIVDYVHHADHMPTLGATLPFSGHVDLTYTCHLACREAVAGAIYAGMSVELAPLAQTPAPSGAPGGRLRMATCGALYKYRQPAAHRWTDFAVAALKSRDAELIHIGPTDEAFVVEVRGALSEAGVEPERYQFAGPVPDLRAALLERGIEIYLASYPDSGGRAILEAMAAGCAPIVPIATEQGELLHCSWPFDQWIPVREPSEMPAAIGGAETLKDLVRGPVGRAVLDREFSRFRDFVTAGAPPRPQGSNT